MQNLGTSHIYLCHQLVIVWRIHCYIKLPTESLLLFEGLSTVRRTASLRRRSDMNRSTKILLVGATFILSVAARAQTSAAQAGAQANSPTSVQSDKSHVQATGRASGLLVRFGAIQPTQCWTFVQYCL